MVKKTEVLAVIQARANSKGLPHKNLLPLHGHPLVAYSVTSALLAIRVTRTIVSTDSEAIAEVAQVHTAPRFRFAALPRLLPTTRWTSAVSSMRSSGCGSTSNIGRR